MPKAVRVYSRNIPTGLKLNSLRMEQQPWQFYNASRLRELESLEHEEYLARLEGKGRVPVAGVSDDASLAAYRNTVAEKERKDRERAAMALGATSSSAASAASAAEAEAATALRRMTPGEAQTAPLLPPTEQAEKDRLLAAAFPSWSRFAVLSLVRCIGRHGRAFSARGALVADAAAELGKTSAEVRRYLDILLTEGPERLAPSRVRVSWLRWPRIEASIRKQESKIEEVRKLMEGARRTAEKAQREAARLLLATPAAPAAAPGAATSTPAPAPAPAATAFAAAVSPVDAACLGAETGTSTGLWTGECDRFLLLCINKVGHGRWDEVHRALHSNPRFAYDYWLRSRSVAEVKR